MDKNQQVVACNATRGPNRELPSADLTTSGALSYFSNVFGFTARRENSGFNETAGWVNNINLLDNAYYAGLVGGNSTKDSFVACLMVHDGINNLSNIPNRFQWIHGGANQTVPTIMLNADIGMVRDLTNHFNSTSGEVQ